MKLRIRLLPFYLVPPIVYGREIEKQEMARLQKMISEKCLEILRSTGPGVTCSKTYDSFITTLGLMDLRLWVAVMER